MQETVLEQSKAAAEINDWLDYKKIPATARAGKKDAIDVLVDAMTEGRLVIDPGTKHMTYTLAFPLSAPKADNDEETGQDTNTLTFRARLTAEAIAQRTKNLKGNDLDGRLMAYIQALTNKPTAVLGRLDTTDLTVCQSVANFFL